MTMPHLMNCDHSADGWCLDCVKKLWEEKSLIDDLWEGVESEERLRRAAQRIVENYKQTGFNPRESTDNATMLAVFYLDKIAIVDTRIASYQNR